MGTCIIFSRTDRTPCFLLSALPGRAQIASGLKSWPVFAASISILICFAQSVCGAVRRRTCWKEWKLENLRVHNKVRNCVNLPSLNRCGLRRLKARNLEVGTKAHVSYLKEELPCFDYTNLDSTTKKFRNGAPLQICEVCNGITESGGRDTRAFNDPKPKTHVFLVPWRQVGRYKRTDILSYNISWSTSRLSKDTTVQRRRIVIGHRPGSRCRRHMRSFRTYPAVVRIGNLVETKE